MQYNFKTNQTKYIPGQITILPKPELRFWEDSHPTPPFGVTSAKVAIIAHNCLWKIWEAGLQINTLPHVVLAMPTKTSLKQQTEHCWFMHMFYSYVLLHASWQASATTAWETPQVIELGPHCTMLLVFSKSNFLKNKEMRSLPDGFCFFSGKRFYVEQRGAPNTIFGAA